jgi:putative ABC transport system permease protein
MIKHIFKLIWNRKGKNALMVLEIFLAFIILFFVMTFVIENLTNYNEPLGFETEQLWVSGLVINEMDSVDIVDMKRNLKRELEIHPNIDHVSFGGEMSPFGGSHSATGNDESGFFILSYLFEIDEKFLETADVPLIEGRWFNEDDKNSKYPPIILTKRLHEEYFDGRPYMDSVFDIHGERKVIGMVENFKYDGQFDDEIPMSFLYAPMENHETPTLYLRLKDGVGIEFEEEMTELVAQVSKLDNVTIDQVEQRRVRSNRSTLIPMIALLSICGFLVLNVALGLFGVLWHNISKRRGEIGLRRALGASKGTIAFQFITEILIIAFFGMFLAALFCIQVPLMDFTEIKDIYFYQAIGISTLVITILVLICAIYPSQQAAHISPAVALHAE